MFLRSYAEAKLYTDETTTTWVCMQVFWNLLCDMILRLHIVDCSCTEMCLKKLAVCHHVTHRFLKIFMPEHNTIKYIKY